MTDDALAILRGIQTLQAEPWGLPIQRFQLQQLEAAFLARDAQIAQLNKKAAGVASLPRLKIAILLYQFFEMAFSRDWDDLPAHVQAHWIEVTEEFLSKLATIQREEDA